MTVTVPHPVRMPSRISDVCDEVIPAEGYRTPLWHEARRGCVSASEIAAVLGISRFQSRFDLWWSKRLADRQPENAAMSRGRRVEPLVIEDFSEEHPHLSLRYVGLARNTERPWQVATPDAIAYDGWPTGRAPGQGFYVDGAGFAAAREPIAVVEAKTDGGSQHWGERGSSDIPIDYKAQVLWQMDTVGVTHGYVPVWIGFDYRCYQVAYDADDVLFMREQAQAFLESVKTGQQPPVDGHKATTDRLKSLHANVVDEARLVPEHLVGQYLAAQRLRDGAAARVRLFENRLRAIVGNANRGVLPDGRKALSRSVYDVDARTQVVGAHTVDRLNVRQPKDARPMLERRSVQCGGYRADGSRCRREHVTSSLAWYCRDHQPKPRTKRGKA